jgi:phenylpyruvate tautomerase PptA (4-oxalocrotonate tautomerase family)
MTITNSPNTDVELQGSPGLNRRAVLMTAAIAATAAAGISPATAETTAAATFGAPLVELQVPPGVLTLEQKAAMIKGITDVVLNATKLTPGPTTVSFVQIIETAQGGFGVNGQVFVPRPK